MPSFAAVTNSPEWCPRRRAAEMEDISYSEFLTRLLRAQWHNRQGKRHGLAHPSTEVARALVAGQFPLHPPGVNRKHIHTFAKLEFIAKAENVVLIENTGMGKIGLAF